MVPRRAREPWKSRAGHAPGARSAPAVVCAAPQPWCARSGGPGYSRAVMIKVTKRFRSGFAFSDSVIRMRYLCGRGDGTGEAARAARREAAWRVPRGVRRPSCV